MPELVNRIKIEFNRISEMKGDKKKTAEYVQEVEDGAKEASRLMVDYVKKHKLEKMAAELTECIRDTIHSEAITAAEGDFTNIELYVLASRYCVQNTYIALFNPELEYDPDKAIAYIMSPNTHGEHEEQDEIMKWYRVMAEYHAGGMDNEDEQLQKGRSKRKNNSG